MSHDSPNGGSHVKRVRRRSCCLCSWRGRGASTWDESAAGRGEQAHKEERRWRKGCATSGEPGAGVALRCRSGETSKLCARCFVVAPPPPASVRCKVLDWQLLRGRWSVGFSWVGPSGATRRPAEPVWRAALFHLTKSRSPVGTLPDLGRLWRAALSCPVGEKVDSSYEPSGLTHPRAFFALQKVVLCF